ncbi:MAG TPA: hypothetical protein VML75_01750 [Kofleriaceae bacterium]|nr:hypothetical protein [Kofleriaceae bacterium]
MNLSLGACGRSWPEVHGVADQAFADHQRPVESIDILPLDMQLWTDRSLGLDPEQVVVGLETRVSHAVSSIMEGSGYDVVAAMGWDGTYYDAGRARARAMEPAQIVDTNYVLSSYGRANVHAGGALVTPYLPHRLGEATGSDATLYVGGWAYVGKDPTALTTGKVIKGVLIGLLIVAVIIVVVAAAKEGGSGVGGAARGAGNVAKGVGKVALHVASGMARGAARAGGSVARGTLRATGRLAEAMAEASADGYGHTNTHIQISGGGARPVYAEQQDSPRTGRSQMYVEMTLVDNRTGTTLWHARQRFLANASKPDQVQAVVRQMVASMPARPTRVSQSR